MSDSKFRPGKAVVKPEFFLRDHIIALILFPLLAGVFLGDVLLQDKSLSAFDIVLSKPNWRAEFDYQGVHELILSDSPTAHYPERKVTWDALKAGHVVSFNPYSFTGFEMISQGVGAIVTSLPALFLDVAGAIDWSTWLRLTLAGLFMYAFLVYLKIPIAGAIFGGIAWTFCQHQIVWLEFPQHLATQLWMPLLLLFNFRLLSVDWITRPWPWQIVAGFIVVNVFFITSGYFQILMYFYALVGVLNTTYLFAETDKPFAMKLRNWCITHGCYLFVGVFVVGILLAEKELISNGLRSVQDRGYIGNMGFSFATITQFPLDLLPTLDDLKRFFTPTIVGGIWDLPLNTKAYSNLVEDGAYVGVLTVFFMLFALLGFGRPIPRKLFLALFVGFLFFYTFNHRSNLILWLLDHIPMFGLGSLSRVITILSLLICVIAAAGFSQFVEKIRLGQWKLPLSLLFAFSVIPIVVRIWHPPLALDKFVYSWSLLTALALAALLVVCFFRKKTNMVLSSAVIALVVVDLFAVNYSFNTRMENDKIFPANEAIRIVAKDAENFRVAVLADTPLYHPNILNYYNIPTIGGYYTLAPVDYMSGLHRFFGKVHLTKNGILFLFEGNMEILRLLNVKYIFSNLKIDTELLELVKEVPGHKIYQFKNPLPRVYCASNAYHWGEQGDTQTLLYRAIKNNDRPVFFYQDVTNPDIPDGELTENCRVGDLNVFTNQLEFTVETDEKTVVMLPYSYYDNWHASIDNQAVKLYKTSHAYMSLVVEPGEHHVTVAYNNGFFTYSAVAILLLGMSILLLVFYYPATAYTRLSFTLIALVMIVYNTFAIPGIRNDRLPERVACEMTSPNELCR